MFKAEILKRELPSGFVIGAKVKTANIIYMEELAKWKDWFKEHSLQFVFILGYLYFQDPEDAVSFMLTFNLNTL